MAGLDWIDAGLQQLANRVGEANPDADVEVTLDPTGEVTIRVDDIYLTFGDDGESIVATRFADNGRRYVIRKDMDWRSLEGYVVRPGDPDAN